MLNPTKLARRFGHPDGRRWEVQVAGSSLLLRITDTEGDEVERKRSYETSQLAAVELEALVHEQLAAGFVELTKPAWRATLDELVAHWEAQDPAFDAAALRDELLAAQAPNAAEIFEHVGGLADQWVVGRDGVATLDLQAAIEGRVPHKDWLKRNAATSLPALLLALRHSDPAAQLEVDGLLAALRRSETVAALMSVLEHPASNSSGRAQHIPSDALIAQGQLPTEVRARLLAALDHDDFRVAEAAAKVLAEQASDQTVRIALRDRSDRARREDGFAWALLRAAEVSQDPAFRPFLEGMQKSRRFRSPGYPERIRDALAGLRGIANGAGTAG